MANRHLLAIHKLEAFKTWLTRQGIKHRPQQRTTKCCRCSCLAILAGMPSTKGGRKTPPQRARCPGSYCAAVHFR